jgi:hypothetical protein
LKKKIKKKESMLKYILALTTAAALAYLLGPDVASTAALAKTANIESRLSSCGIIDVQTFLNQPQP